MRVLILHSRYLSGPASGENRVVADEHRLLEEAGHAVRTWVPEPEATTRRDRVALAAGAVWSRESAAEVESTIASWRPDVVHFHNLFPRLSPAALRAAERAGVPSVVTLHNFRYLCLPATLLRDGRVCEDCVGRVPWPGVVHRCYRDSALGSATLAASLTLHRAGRTFDRVAVYAAVSGFLRDKYVAAGWSGDRIVVKGNFAWPSPRREGAGSYFLYLGRLSPEKGVTELVRLWRHVDAPLVVVGGGPLEGEVRAAASANVELRGAIEAEEVASVVAGARALVVPSRCYEGQPRSILEAYAAGVPVLASAMGGLPEAVADGATGLLVEPDDDDAWADAAARLCDDAESERMGAAAFEAWRRSHSPEHALAALEELYARAVATG